jgi:hypothetical protein
VANQNPDIVPYSTKGFLESMLGSHSAVESFRALDHCNYEVIRRRDLGPKVSLCLTGKYLFSASDYYDARKANSLITCIVLASAWNRYTSDAKSTAKNDHVGLFTMKELAGALNMHDLWTYEAGRSE